MTATLTEAETYAIPLTADEVIACGRELYRRAQQANWPEEGTEALRRASSRLWTETEICARIRDDGMRVTPGRIASARKAAGELIAVMDAYCGDAAGTLVSGQVAA
jgi:hypothetical protein